MSASFWDKRAQRYDDKIKEHDALYERMIDSTHSLQADSDVVLDFGCGSGEMSLDIAPHVGRVHGIDISAKMIELAREKTRQRHVENVHFDQFDVFDEALDGGSYSAIVAFYIFHLLDDVPRALTRLNDLLTAGGLLISTTPCMGERGWFFRFLIGLAQRVGMAPKILSLRIAELESLVSRSSLEIVETKLLDEKTALHWIVARKV